MRRREGELPRTEVTVIGAAESLLAWERKGRSTASMAVGVGGRHMAGW